MKENSNFNPQLVNCCATWTRHEKRQVLFGITFTLHAKDTGADVDVQAHGYIYILVMSTVGSIAAAGIPHGSLSFSTASLQSAELPVNRNCILFTVDWLIDSSQTVNNVIVNNTVQQF